MRSIDVNNINLSIENIDFWSANQWNKGGMRIYWSSDIGFGTVDIVKRSGLDGDDFESKHEKLELTAATETMDCNEDKQFTKKLLEALVEKLNIID